MPDGVTGVIVVQHPSSKERLGSYCNMHPFLAWTKCLHGSVLSTQGLMTSMELSPGKLLIPLRKLVQVSCLMDRHAC